MIGPVEIFHGTAGNYWGRRDGTWLEGGRHHRTCWLMAGPEAPYQFLQNFHWNIPLLII